MTQDEKKKLLMPVATYLAAKYNAGRAVEIAELCDTRLDPTGNLLGWVREEALRLRSP